MTEPAARRAAAWAVGAGLAAILALTAAAYAATASRVGLHSDFLEFYTAGRLFREDRGSLYDFEVQYARQRALVREAGGAVDPGPLPFIYPPLVAAFFAGLTPLGYFGAFYSWLALSVLLVAASAAALARGRGLGPWSAASLLGACLCFVPFSVNCLAGGQLGGLALAVYACVYLLLREGKDEAAGAVFALSFYKPPLFAGFLLLALLDRRGRFLKGFLAAAVVVIVASAACVGWDGLWDYVRKAAGYRYGQPFMPGRILVMARSVGPFQALHHVLPGAAALVVYALLAGWALTAARVAGKLRGARGSREFALRFAVEASVSLALAPHLLDYDTAALLAPMLLVLSGGAPAPGWAIAAGLYTEFAYRPAFYALFGFQPLTVWLLLWVVWLTRMGKQATLAAPSVSRIPIAGA